MPQLMKTEAISPNWQARRGDLTAIASVASGLGHPIQYLRDREAGCFLPRWIFLERCEKVTHQRLRRHRQEGVIEQPIVVGIRRDRCALKRIGT
jgi:hypothetical protein